MKKAGTFLINNRYYAALAVLILALLPVFTFLGWLLAATIVALVTFSRGPRNGAYLIIGVALLTVGFWWFYGWAGYEVVLALCVFSWVFANLIGLFNSWCLTLEAMFVTGLLVLIALHVAVPNLTGWWVTHLSRIYGSSSLFASVPPEEMKQMVARLAPIATGIAGFFVMGLLTLVLVWARLWQAAIVGAKQQCRQEMCSIRMNKGDAVLFLLCLIGALFQVMYLAEVVWLLMLPFVVASFSLLHSLSHKKRLRWVLVLAYVFLVWLVYLAAPVLALVGATDSWLDIRSRFIKAG